MTLPVRMPLRLYQGDTKLIPLRFYTSRARATALDVSDRTFAATIDDGAGTQMIVAVPDMSQAAEGLVVLEFLAADVGTLEPDDEMRYDVQQTDAAGRIKTLLAGPVTVEAQAT